MESVHCVWVASSEWMQLNGEVLSVREKNIAKKKKKKKKSREYV